MMRTNHFPLARLVDAAAEKWLMVEHASEQKRLSMREEITASFGIGDNAELTYHGLRYQLRIYRDSSTPAGKPSTLAIDVHKIVL